MRDENAVFFVFRAMNLTPGNLIICVIVARCVEMTPSSIFCRLLRQATRAMMPLPTHGVETTPKESLEESDVDAGLVSVAAFE